MTERGDPAGAPAIVIATGGAGRRIGGAKADRMLGSRRLVDHVIGWARQHSDFVALAANSAAPDRSGLPVLIDAQPDLGPISALSSAMRFAAERGRARVLLVGCDTPFLPPDLVLQLTRAIAGNIAALPRRGERLHTLAGLWRSDPAVVEAWITGGGRSLWGLAERAGLAIVDWPTAGPDPFANLNTPEDLAAAAARLTAPER